MLTNLEKPSLSNEDNQKPLFSELFDKVESTVSANIKFQTQVSKQIESLTDNLMAETRSKNLVIFGLPEAGTGTVADKVNEIVEKCSKKLDVCISQVHRLGAKRESGPRPVKLCLSSEGEKWELVKRINSVRPDGVYARLDLTKEEQHQDFLLRQELKQAKQEDPSGVYKIRKNQVIKVN
jgi:adenylylsulfate kinase-like enzyme